MNKSDIRLILITTLLILITIIILNINNKNGKYAVVYYENKEVKRIDLSIDDEYTVKGYNGDITISVKSNSIAVIKENSPKHLCSKQGYVSSSLEPIVCLPNKIVIKILSIEDEVDTVVR